MRGLADREMIMPHFELAILNDKWPDSYTIEIDSSTYYGTGDGFFHPSSHPLKGARQLYYLLHPDHQDKIVRERPTLQKQMRLAMGSALHGVIQTQMQMAGLIASQDDIEVEYIIPEHHVRGRIDWVCKHPEDPELIVELKTRDARLYSKQEAILPSWDAQLSLAEYAMGKDHGILLMAEYGGNNNLREFPHKRNDQLLDEIFTKFSYVRDCIAKNTPPSHCCLPDSSEMKSCKVRYSCWMAPNGQGL